MAMKERKARTKTEFVHIRHILNTVLGTCRPDAVSELERIQRLWDGVVGSAIAENTRPAAMKGGILLVHVTSPVWIHQLQFVKGDITAGLNQALGDHRVTEIKFKVGPL